MNRPELIKSHEMAPVPQNNPSGVLETLTRQEVDVICNARFQFLESIKPIISLKFYHQIIEKLEQEKQQFGKLLEWRDNTEDLLSHYSFVLNPGYFEQKFL